MVLDKIRKGVDTARTAAGYVSPGAGKVVGAARAAGTVGKNAASWAAFAGVEDLFESIKDPGFLLFIMGTTLHFLGHFILGLFGLAYDASSSLRILFSLVFLFYSVFFIFKGRGLLLTALFIVWYFWFGTSINIAFFTAAGLVILLYNLFFKLKEGEFVIGEEIVGLLPILIFYLDIGLVSFLVVRFDLTVTPLLQSLILLMPWWGFFGLMTTERQSAFISVLKLLGFAYVFLIILGGVVTEAGLQATIPGFGEITESREEVEQEIDAPSSLRISYWRTGCTLQHPADPESIDNCLNERQAEYACDQQHEKGTDEYTECFNQEMGIGVQGETVERLTATRVEFERPREIYSSSLEKNNTQYPIPYNIIYESTEKPVSITLSCRFKDNTDDREIAGRISPDHLSHIQAQGPQARKRISCIPEEPYASGNYDVIFEATVHDITTISFLDRIFIAAPQDEEDRHEENQILRDRGLKGVQGARAGEEFAAYYFEIGTQETLIYGEYEPTQSIYGNVKNLKDGKIISIDDVEIDLRDPGISPVSCEDFIQQGNLMVWTGPGMPDLNCQLEIPQELRDLSTEYEEPEFIHMQFKAYMTYDYKITKEDSFTIR